MKVHIYFRHTPPSRTTQSGRPDWFTHELCFANLLKTVTEDKSGTGVHLSVLFDGSEEDLKKDYTPKHIDLLGPAPLGAHTRFHRFHGGSQVTAWKACLALALEDIRSGTIADDDLLYFLENDYLHRPGWLSALTEFERAQVPWDYLALYDHPDLYMTDMYRSWKSKVVLAGDCHWQTAPSTCWTFITRKKRLLRDKHLLAGMFHDHHVFFLLTRVLRRKLFTPLPGLSTHCASLYLSPRIDWAALAQADRAASIAWESATS